MRSEIDDVLTYTQYLADATRQMVSRFNRCLRPNSRKRIADKHWNRQGMQREEERLVELKDVLRALHPHLKRPAEASAWDAAANFVTVCIRLSENIDEAEICFTCEGEFGESEKLADSRTIKDLYLSLARIPVPGHECDLADAAILAVGAAKAVLEITTGARELILQRQGTRITLSAEFQEARAAYYGYRYVLEEKVEALKLLKARSNSMTPTEYAQLLRDQVAKRLDHDWVLPRCADTRINTLLSSAVQAVQASQRAELDSAYALLLSLLP